MKANWFKILGTYHGKKNGHCNSLLMGLGQDLQQHPVVHSGSYEGEGPWLWPLVTCERGHVTRDTCLLTCDI